MDEDDEDFEALFFAEAKELLETLQEQLNLLADGTGDQETIHAAFRAVHSVKGGSAAFGFERLIGFAHLFETVMDRIREGALEPDDAMHVLLLRAGDMMQVLVEDAQNGTGFDQKTHDRLMSELGALSGEEVEDETSPASSAVEEDAPDADCPSDHAPETRQVLVRITPDAEFTASGHDMRKVVRAARTLGLKDVHYVGSVPTIDAFDAKVYPVGFELTFDTAANMSQIEDFFRIYEHIAQVEFLDDIDVDEVPEDDEDASGALDDAGAAGQDGGASRTSAPSGPSAVARVGEERRSGAERPGAPAVLAGVAEVPARRPQPDRPAGEPCGRDADQPGRAGATCRHRRGTAPPTAWEPRSTASAVCCANCRKA